MPQQPSLAYDESSRRFVMAYREQNFLTSIRVSTKAWGDGFWPNAAQVPGTTSATAPSLAATSGARNVLWYGGE